MNLTIELVPEASVLRTDYLWDTDLAESDSVAVRLSSGEEVNSFPDILTVLVLTRHVVTRRAVSRLVTDLRCLK